MLYNTLFAPIKFTNWKVHSLFTSKIFNGFLFIYLFVCLFKIYMLKVLLKNKIKKTDYNIGRMFSGEETAKKPKACIKKYPLDLIIELN